MSKHTEGPWIIDGEKGEYVSPLDRHEKIAIASILCVDEEDCESGNWVRGKETNANARLISAAPELLAALEEVFIIGDRLVSDVYGTDFVRSAKAAIAKARGQQ